MCNGRLFTIQRAKLRFFHLPAKSFGGKCYKINKLPRFYGIGSHINNTYRHYHDCSHLSDCIAGESHQQGEDGSAEESHNHQARYFVLLVGHSTQGTGKDEGEGVAVAISQNANGSVEYPLGVAHHESYHSDAQQADAEEEECAIADAGQDVTSRKTTDRTAEEVEAGGESCFVERHAETFHQDLGSRSVGAHIDSYMADDGNEAALHAGQRWGSTAAA